MPSVSTHFEVVRHFQQKVSQANSYELVYGEVSAFLGEQIGIVDVELSETAVSPTPSSPSQIHLKIPNTSYSLKLTRLDSFTKEELALVDLMCALLASAPFFEKHGDAARSRFLEVVYSVAETIRTQETLNDILDTVHQKLLDVFSAPSGYIGIYDNEKQVLSFPCVTHNDETAVLDAISLINADSLAAWVVANGLPYVTGDWENDNKPVAGVPKGEFPSSIICVPLLLNDVVYGVVSVQSREKNAFSDEDFEILTAVAPQLASAIENAHNISQTKALVEKGTRDYQAAVALRQAISVISSTLDKKSIVNHLLLALDGVFTYDTAFIFLLEEKQVFRLAAGRDILNRPLDQSPDQLETTWRDSDLFNNIQKNKEPVLIMDTQQDERWQPFPGSEKIKSWLGTPLITGGELLGILIVQSYRVHTLTKQQEWLASTLAAHTAVALQNATLYLRTQQQLNELSTLYQASATMTANLDQDFVLQTVVVEMVRALQVDSCTIFVWNAGRQHLIPAAHSNLAQTKAQLWDKNESPIQASIGLSRVPDLEKNQIIQHVFKTKEIFSLRYDSAHSQDRLDLLEDAGLQTALLVPLVRKGDVLGLLALGQVSEPRSFTSQEQRLAQNLAGQAAVAIEHAHLYSKAQRRVEELATFHNIVLQLNTPLKLNTVLDAITESALKLVDASNLHIYLYDQQTGEFSKGSALWRDGRRTPAVAKVRKDGMTASVIKQGEPIIINDARSHPLFQSEETKYWGIEAIAGFPLKRGDTVIGAFTITYLHPHRFTEDEILLLNLLADQASVAVRNARLFAESQRRLRDMSALVDMAQKVTGKLKISSVLQTTVKILQGLLNARASTITMLSEDRSELVVQAAVGVNPEYMQARMKLDEGVSGAVVRTGDLINIRDTYSEPDFLFFSEVVRSLLVVPLIVRSETIGTLTIDSDQPNAFSDLDVQLMMIAAAQVSIAISNAGLFEEVEKRATELAVAYEELKESDRLKDELVQNVSHELRTPLTFVKGYVDLLMDGEMGLVSSEQQEALHIVAEKTDEITRIIDDIITLQRIDAGNLQLAESAMADLIKTAVSGHRIVAEKKGLTISAELPPAPGLVLMDKGRINQVLDNLIANAMKFSPNGGVINVGLEDLEDEVRVIVSDQGVGMPKEKQTRIFDRFYQIDGSSRRRFGGTGIGLAIVKRIIDAHHGKIWVESEIDVGSSFHFTLPKARKE
jgi:GAF domain-containing protein